MTACPDPAPVPLTRFGPAAGIAIGPILFVIAILAVLAAAIAAGSGSFSGGTSSEDAKLKAQAIIARAQEVADAVNRVMLSNGCADTQINFNSAAHWNNNTNAPADHSCDLFDPRGGGVLARVFPANYFSLTTTYAGATGFFWANAANRVVNIGTHANGAASVDLLLTLWGLSDAVCSAINAQVKYNAPSYSIPTKSIYGAAGFGGYYDYNATNLGFGSGVNEGCFYYYYTPGGGQNIYAKVLIAR